MLRGKPMVPGFRPLIAIGYKYNSRKVVSLIVIDNTGITKSVLPYLSKYLDQFSNISVHPISCPLFMYKFFGYVNEV